MRHFLFTQFHTLFSQLAAFAVVAVLSVLVAGYSYVQAKQIKIEADLLIAGEVRTNNLCIGPPGAQVCRTAWPAELLNTDVVAGGASRDIYYTTGCNQPNKSSFYLPYYDTCYAFWLTSYNPWFDAGEYDPRAVFSTSYIPGGMGCYTTPDGSNNPCGPERTYPVFSSFSCSGGFVAVEPHPLALALYAQCRGTGPSLPNCRAAICRPP